MNRVIFGDCRDTMRDLKAQGVREAVRGGRVRRARPRPGRQRSIRLRRRHPRKGRGEMTKEEAENLKTFDNPCTCGGFAWQINGRKQEQPHMNWCPQYDEYEEWYQALHSDKAT